MRYLNIEIRNRTLFASSLIGADLSSWFILSWKTYCHDENYIGPARFYECGPMKQLKAMMKRINMDMWKNTTNIHV